MDAMGLLGATVSENYGVSSKLCVNQIFENGSPTQREKCLPELCSAEHRDAPAMSKPYAGSDVVSQALQAQDKGDHYRLHGRKM